MSNIEITLRKSGSLFDLDQKEEAKNPQAKQTYHLSIDQNTIPRTYSDHNGLIPYALSLATSGSSFSLENDKIREMLASEMGVAPSVVFDDIKGIVTKLSNKIAAAEHASGNTVNTISKLLSKLVCFVACSIFDHLLAKNNPCSRH
jgi:hypothetical protein